MKDTRTRTPVLETPRLAARGLRFLSTLGLVAAMSAPALAEGEAQFGYPASGQPLKSSTDLRIDILEAGETVSFTGVGNLILQTADGTLLEELVAPLTGAVASTAALPVGTLRATLTQNQRIPDAEGFFGWVGWDITVRSSGGVVRDGRLHSRQWVFETGYYNRERAANVSFYALTPGGATGTDIVVEMKMEGLNGNEYQVGSNRTGLLGANSGRSVPDPNGSEPVPVEHPMYLNVPAKALFNGITPSITDFRYVGNDLGCPLGDGEDKTVIASPSPTGYFTFQTNVAGTYQIICDMNRDGVFRAVGGTDLVLVGATSANFVPWDARFNGQPIVPNTYECKISIFVGEFHFAVRDMETGFRGLRMFEVNPNMTRTPLKMLWDDTLVQDIPGTQTGAVIMPLDPPNPLPDGFPVADQLQLVSPPLSPPGGLSSGLYDEPTLVYGIRPPYNLANPTYRAGNSRGWGAFLDPTQVPTTSKISKGEKAVLDTYTYARISESTPFTIDILADQDTDGDGCKDLKEICEMGTLIDDVDTDEDGLEDCDEYEFNDNPTDPTDPDTDGDGLCDGAISVAHIAGVTGPLGELICIPGEDVDEDGVHDEDEGGTPTETDPADPDTDNDGWCDGPLVPAGQTKCDDPSDNCPLVYNPDQSDVDGDGIGDACDDLDCDPDRDGIPNLSDPECWPDTPPPTDPCTGGATALCIDNCLENANSDQADLDADGVGDICECDVDGDGIRDSSDVACWPDLPPGTPPPTDPCDDLQTTLCIDNCVVTPNADQGDLDGDGQGDACDCDIDGDGIRDKSARACWPELPPETPTPTAPCEDMQTDLCLDNCARTPNADQADLDDDGAGDVCDCDIDGDTIRDKSWRECWPEVPEGDPTPESPCANLETELCLDNCVFTPNVGQADLDEDGEGDDCDCDIDGDTIRDKSARGCWPEVPPEDPTPTASCEDEQTALCLDNCPVTPNALQEDRNDDGEGDACECDRDGDGVVDNSARVCWPDVPPETPTPTDSCADLETATCLDNCPDVVNPNQADSNDDGEGDACTCDRDGDGVVDNPDPSCWDGPPPAAPCTDDETEGCLDNCADVVNAEQEDLDGDGIGDACDCDIDGDGIKDKNTPECWPGQTPPNDVCPDEVTQGCLDNCARTPNAEQEDLDGDGLGDECDPDIDGDDLLNVEEDKNNNGVVDPGETDPRNPDTDGGGEKDGAEVNNDRDPLDPCDDFGGTCQILLEGGGGCAGGGSELPLSLAVFGLVALVGWTSRRRSGIEQR